jgi:hypothetical protein
MKLYKYSEYFGRMGSLQSVFVSDEDVVNHMRAAGQVYLGEVLGKHSEITATIDEKTLRELPESQEVVAFFREHLNGLVGYNIIDSFLNQEENE